MGKCSLGLPSSNKDFNIIIIIIIIGSASFVCFIVALFGCKITGYQQQYSDNNNHSLFNVGTASQTVSSFLLCVQSQST